MSKENKLTLEDINSVKDVVVKAIIELVPPMVRTAIITDVPPIVESIVDKKLDKFAGMVKRGFDEVYERFDLIDNRFDDVYKRFDFIDEKFDLIHENILVINDDINRMDRKIDKNYTELIKLNSNHETRIVRLEQNVV